MGTKNAHILSAFVAGGAALTVAVVAGCATEEAAPSASASPAVAASPAGETVANHDAHEGHNMSKTASPGATEHGASHGSHAMGTKGLSALQSLKGREFDVAFLSQMITHHAAAVDMAKQALKTATKPETKQEAQKVIDAQTKEIAQMTGWLKEWYKTTPDAAQQALVKEDMKAMMAMPVTTDAMFFEMMIPHHQGAIDMSKLVPTRSERPEVRKLAEQIIAAQEAEIKAYQKHLSHGDHAS